jgi:hypothetical protein
MASESGRDQDSASVALKLVGAWTLVGIPLAWGVWQVIQKSLDLFK